MFRRDPLDGALDATLVVIMKQQSLNWFRVEEVFLGNIDPGQHLGKWQDSETATSGAMILTSSKRFGPWQPVRSLSDTHGAARDISDERQRVAALWPFLWSHNGSCFQQSKAELEKIGPLHTTLRTYRQKDK